jgi:hypothetical protein
MVQIPGVSRPGSQNSIPVFSSKKIVCFASCFAIEGKGERLGAKGMDATSYESCNTLIGERRTQFCAVCSFLGQAADIILLHAYLTFLL